MNNLHFLNSKNWATDYGFEKTLNIAFPKDRNPGTYYQTDKSHKCLWDLLMYADSDKAKVILFYFDLPEDTIEFLRWVYDYAHSNYKRPYKANQNQMDFFPYSQLYQVWYKLGKRKISVVVNDKHITTSEGRVLYANYKTAEINLTDESNA